MKLHLKIVLTLVCLFCLFSTSVVLAQDSIPAQPDIAIRYFVHNNNIHYLMVQTRVKVGKKFQPVPAQPIAVYLDSNSKENLIGTAVTDNHGNAKIAIPTILKNKWNSSATHSFITLLADPVTEITSTLDITKARINLDTSTVDSVRTVIVNVQFYETEVWKPAPDVEMKIGVIRSGGVLSAGDEATYTTDSSGTVSVDFTKHNLPGDVNSNFVLVAKVEDNELYGNLSVEKVVPWGIALKTDAQFFDQRTLWSTRFKTPLWLLFMAYGIVFLVWGVIIYLVIALIKIKKLGKMTIGF